MFAFCCFAVISLFSFHCLLHPVAILQDSVFTNMKYSITVFDFFVYSMYKQRFLYLDIHQLSSIRI